MLSSAATSTLGEASASWCSPSCPLSPAYRLLKLRGVQPWRIFQVNLSPAAQLLLRVKLSLHTLAQGTGFRAQLGLEVAQAARTVSSWPMCQRLELLLQALQSQPIPCPARQTPLLCAACMHACQEQPETCQEIAVQVLHEGCCSDSFDAADGMHSHLWRSCLESL